MSMTIQEAINAVSQGIPITCPKELYPNLRLALQKYAGEQIDSGQDVYAIIALSEVKRLDKEFNFLVRSNFEQLTGE